MNHQKLFRFAQLAIKACTEIEKTHDLKGPPHPEYDTCLDSMNEEERQLAIDFIGNVNGLRLEIKRKFWDRPRLIDPEPSEN